MKAIKLENGDIRIIHSGGAEITFIPIKDKSFTPSGGIRDCGDHYIYAMYASYARIDRETVKITYDVEDR